MRFNLSRSDKWFFYSIPPYLVIGIADIVYKWFDVELVTIAWLVYLIVGMIRFRLWKLP